LSKWSQRCFEKNSFLSVSQPPSSRDLAVSDFWIFGHIKDALQGLKFERPDALLQGISDFLNRPHWWSFFTIGSNVCAG
jgi:hypothetical protein